MVTNMADGKKERGAPLEAVSGKPLYASQSGVKGAPPLVLLHGLFGMGSNLGALARAVNDRFEVHQIDLPNHGRSPWSNEMSIASMAVAVQAYLRDTLGGPAHFVGHSLGGKVAMQLALMQADLVSSLVVADIAPIAYRGSHDAVFAAIDAVEAAGPANRREAGEVMREYVTEEGVVQFLSLSLYRGDDGVYHWRFNARELYRNYAALRAAPRGEPYSGPALFVSGDRSPYVREDGVAAARALFPAAEFFVIEGTGHWLHAEKPAEFNARVSAFLDSSAAAA